MKRAIHSGIYSIKHRESGKCYVGSSVDIEARWGSHRRELKKNTHHSSRLQGAWNECGASAFEFVLLEATELASLVEREEFWIIALAAYTSGYNVKRRAGNNRGAKQNPEARVKAGAALKGRKMGPLSAEHRAKLSAAHMGIRPSAETRAKMSASMKRRGPPKISEEARARSNVTKRGAKRTPEQCARISASLMGKPRSEELRAKLRASWARRIASGYKQSPDQVAQRVAAVMKTWAAKRACALPANGQSASQVNS